MRLKTTTDWLVFLWWNSMSDVWRPGAAWGGLWFVVYNLFCLPFNSQDLISNSPYRLHTLIMMEV